MSNNDIQNQAPDTSNKLKKGKNKGKLILFFSLILITGIIIGVIIFNNTAWKRNFEIKYIGYNSNLSGGSYQYSITNLTSNYYRNVKAVIHISNVYGDFSFEDNIGTVRQHEVIDYELMWYKVKKSANEKGIKLLLAEPEIERIVWS